jgi:hypothetical protein
VQPKVIYDKNFLLLKDCFDVIPDESLGFPLSFPFFFICSTVPSPKLSLVALIIYYLHKNKKNNIIKQTIILTQSEFHKIKLKYKIFFRHFI